MSWTKAALREVCTVVSGATPKTNEARFWGGNILWATPKDLSNLQSAYFDEPERRITEEGLKSCAATVLPKNSVLLSSRAPIGLVAINTKPMATNQGFKSLVPDPRKVDSRYLYFWLRANKTFLQSLGNGATFKEISKSVVGRVEIPLPSLVEQHRIAAILDKADALRQKRKRVLRLVENLRQSLFTETFGDPIENPIGLPTAPLHEVVSSERKITYGILKPGPDVPDGIPYVRVIDIQNGEIAVENLKRTSQAIAREYRRSSLRVGDLLISIRGHVGRMAIVPKECEGANITQDSARLAVELANTEFVKAQLETEAAQRWMAQRTRGAAVQGINLGDLKQFPLLLPPRADQEEFADKIATLRKAEMASATQLGRLDSFFSSLQSRAFSGQL